MNGLIHLCFMLGILACAICVHRYYGTGKSIFRDIDKIIKRKGRFNG